MATTPTPTPVTAEEKTYTYFSADTFESVSETVKVSFNKPTDLSDAMARIGNDQGIVLKALTNYLQRLAYGEAKRAVLGKGISKKIVLSVLRPFRSLAPWSLIEDRKKQTDELIKMLRSNPAIIEAIKSASAVAVENDEDDDAEDKEDA